MLAWRFRGGETAVMTELKLLDCAQGQRLIMLTFAASAVDADLVSAVEQLPFDLLILDINLKVTYANPGAVRSSGATGGILGCSALTLTPLSALPEEVYRRALEGCHYHDDAVELPALTAQGRCFEVDVQPLKGPSGIVGLAVLSTEVSRRGLLKSAQGSSERRLRALTENALDIITVAAPDGRLQYVSGGVTNTLGYTSEERHLNSIFDHAHPEDVGPLRVKFNRLTAGEIDRFTHQYRLRHKDGSYRWLETIYVSALDNPLINGVVMNSRDITERKEAESQARPARGSVSARGGCGRRRHLRMGYHPRHRAPLPRSAGDFGHRAGGYLRRRAMPGVSGYIPSILQLSAERSLWR